MTFDRLSTLLCLLVCGMVCLPTTARAQSRTGAWWEVAIGAGSGRITCELCDPAREEGPVASLAVGAYANPRLRVGLEGSAWTAEEQSGRETTYSAGLIAQLHPRPASGLHVIGGLGWTGYRAEGNRLDALRLSLGAGWDLPLVGEWVVGNRLVLDAASHFPLRGGDAVVESSAGLSVVRLHVYLRRS